MPVTGLCTTNLKVQVRNFGSFEELQFLDKYMLNWQSLQSAEICFNALFIVLNYDYFKKLHPCLPRTKRQIDLIINSLAGTTPLCRCDSIWGLG